MLTLIIGGAASVPALAILGDAPWRHLIVPLRVVAGNNITMAIGHNCWQVIALHALRNQKRARISAWIWKDFTGKAKICQAGNKLVIKIGLQRGLATRKIAFGLKGDAAGEFDFKTTIFEIIINFA